MPPLVMFRLVVACVLFLVSGPSFATELKGKVTGVTDRQVRLSVEGDYLPQVGDEVTISFQLPGGPLVRVGTWKVSAVQPDFVEATVVEATGKPTVDQVATINSPNPTRRNAPAVSSSKPGSAPRQIRAKLLYQGKIYDTAYERETIQGRPLDRYFFEIPGAGSLPAGPQGKELRNYFERIPATDYHDQSKVEWLLTIFVYRNHQWELDQYSGVAVEILERYEGPPKKR